MEKSKPDARIAELTDHYFQEYETKYLRKPLWGGKEARLLQRTIKVFESRSLDPAVLKDCISGYLKDESDFVLGNVHSFGVFAANPDKYIPRRDTKHAERMVEKAKELFCIKDALAQIDHKVKDFTLEDLVDSMKNQFPPDENGCVAWIRGQKRMRTMLKEGTRLYNMWLRAGKAGRVYFGDEMVEKLWKTTQVNTADDKVYGV